PGLNEISGRTLGAERQEMRRDRGRLHAGSRGSGEYNLRIARHVACAAVSLIPGERLDKPDQVANRVQRRRRGRLVEQEDVGRQRVQMATLKHIDRLGLVRAQVLVDEIVSVAIASWDGAQRLEILNPLESRGDARRTVTRMTWDRTLRAQRDS